MQKVTKTDSQLEVEGTWVKIDDEQGGICEVKVARSGGSNLEYEATMQKKAKPFRSKGKEISPNQATRILNETLSETIITDWKKSDFFLDDDGSQAKHSVKNAYELLLIDDDFKKNIMRESDNIDNFLTKKS